MRNEETAIHFALRTKPASFELEAHQKI